MNLLKFTGIRMSEEDYYYSEKYEDDKYEYRYAFSFR